MKIKSQKFKAFTLVELLVVIGILLVTGTIVTNSFLAALKGTTKTTLTNEAKQNGEYALSIIEQQIRSAWTISNIASRCTTTGNPQTRLDIENQVGTVTRFECLNNRLYKDSNALTSNKVVVGSCEFICTKQGTQPAIIKIKFTVSQSGLNPQNTPIAGVTVKPAERVSINYETSVVVRNTGM